MISDNLPVIPIVLTILGAPLCMLLRSPRVSWPVAMAVMWSAFAACCMLLAQVLREGTVSYSLGNWPPPFGIEFRVDVLNGFILPLVSGIAAVTLTYAPKSLSREVPSQRHSLLYAVFLLCVTGLLGMTVTADAFNVFVFLEISSLSTYALVSMGPDRRALMASYRYLVMGTIGGTFFLIGIGLLYMKTGTLNMADLGERLAPIRDSRTVLAGFAFLAVGLSLKVALFPLHLWLPNAYAYAPSAMTPFLAATATKVSIYVAIRFFFTVLGVGFTFGSVPIATTIKVLALVGIFVASVVACFQTDIKRMLAYSSVAQIGYIVVGISLFSVTALTGSLVHVFNHALIKGGLFMVLGCMAFRTGTVTLDDLRGIGRRMPITTMAFVIGGVGLIGVPFTAGFVSKWYIVLGAVEQGHWPVAVFLLLSSLLALIYVWRVVEVAYFDRPADEGAATGEAPLTMLLPTVVMVAATIYFGINTEYSVGMAERAARMLMGGSP